MVMRKGLQDPLRPKLRTQGTWPVGQGGEGEEAMFRST